MWIKRWLRIIQNLPKKFVEDEMKVLVLPRMVLIEKVGHNEEFYTIMKNIDILLQTSPSITSTTAIHAYPKGKWLKDELVRKALVENGFKVFDSMDTKDIGYIIRRNKQNYTYGNK